MLPLYPGLIAFLVGTAGNRAGRRGGALLGAVVLAGVLTMMVALGFALYLLQQTFSAILPWLLPAVYGVVILLGGAMLLSYNPFARLATARAPILRNSADTAFLHGLLLGPMTLPCTGPLLISAFVLGAGSPGALAGELFYFLVFIGFGWPLVLLPLVASPIQRRFTGWLAGHTRPVGLGAGLLLVAIGLFGFWVDVLPNLAA